MKKGDVTVFIVENDHQKKKNAITKHCNRAKKPW